MEGQSLADLLVDLLVDLLADLLVASGRLPVDRGLPHDLAEIAGTPPGDERDKAGKKLRDLDKRLVELRRDGKLTPAGFDALDALTPDAVADQ